MRGGRLGPRTGAVCALALVTGSLLSGCSGSSAGAAAQATNLPARACSGGVSTGDLAVSIVFDGVSRPVVVHVPNGYTDRTPEPLVLNLHGSGSTAAAQEAFSGMDSASDSDGFIVAYPQGGITSGSGYDWNVPGEPLLGGAAAPANAPNDVAFLADVIQRLEAGMCIDPNRVFSTGFSGGARMTSQLGCDLPGTIAAIAPVSGLRLPAPCAGTRSVPVISFHGTADPIDPYSGNGQAYWTYSVPVAAQRWAAHDGCAATPDQTTPAPKVTLTKYAGCQDAAAVELYTITGEGHEWPGGPTLPTADTSVLGAQSNAIDADSTIWQFFEAHPLPVS
jgi:polyhydroxybutyrate depolymerase